MSGGMLERTLRGWSPRWRPTRFKATLIGIVVAAFVVPLLLLAIPYLEVFNDMAVQPKGKAQGLYGWFSDEGLIVERAPVAGTIPIEGLPPAHPYAKDDEEAAKRAGRELVNPLSPTRDVLALGRKRFETFCFTCHGKHAEGNGPVVGPDLFPAPPSLHTDTALGFADGRIYHVITKGQNKMPTYADVLEPDERWAVVHYVRALQKAYAMDPEEAGR